MVIGYQKETVQSLLADAGPGTPQRFIYLTTHDGSIPDQRISFPDTIDLSEILDHKTQFLGGTVEPVKDTITFDDAIKDELWRNDRARQRQELIPGPLDGHEPLTRCKVAALLAVLDGRFHVATEDWELSKTVWTVSCAVRDDAISFGQVAARLKAEKQIEAEAYRADVLADRVDDRHQRKVEKLARNVALYVAVNSQGDSGVGTSRAKQDTISGRDRKTYGDDAVEHALRHGWVVKHPLGERLLPGQSRPL
jgi:hypothetical protein